MVVAGGVTAHAEENVTLNVFDAHAYGLEEYDEMVKAFEESHPGVTVDVQHAANDYDTLLQSRVNSGDTPDVFDAEAGTKAKMYYDYAYDWADFHKWGMRGGNITRNADDHCCGQAYIELYKISPDPAKIKNIKAAMDMLVNTPQVNDWTWIDAIQMGMPIFAQLGKLTGEQKYYDKMWQMYSCSRNNIGGNGLFNHACKMVKWCFIFAKAQKKQLRNS